MAQTAELLTEEKAKEASLTEVGQTVKALSDSARKRKVKVKKRWEKLVNETRTVLDRV